MYHTIEFAVAFWMDIEISPKHRLERVGVKKGQRLKVHVRTYVVESTAGPLEVADLFFEDGSATRQMPCGCFKFVD